MKAARALRDRIKPFLLERVELADPGDAVAELGGGYHADTTGSW